MKIQIKKRYSNDIKLEGEADSLKEFIKNNKSDLSGSNLSDSDLRYSDLSGCKIKITQKE